MPPKLPPIKGTPKKVKPSRYDFISANLPAINVSSLNQPNSIAHDRLKETKDFFPSSVNFMSKFLPAIKVSRANNRALINKHAQVGNRETGVPLKEFINTLLPAVSVSKDRDCFSPHKAAQNRKNDISFFNQCQDLLQELEHEKFIAGKLPKQERSEALKEEYIDSLASNSPHSILLRYDVLNCVSKLLNTIVLLPPEKCEVYLTRNFPVDDYPFEGLNGLDIAFMIYASLNGASSSRDRSYVLNLFAKILSIDSNSLIGPFVSDNLKSTEFLASIFKTSKVVDLFTRVFIQSNQFAKALRVFASAYLSKPSLLNLDVTESEIFHVLQQHQNEPHAAKKPLPGVPSLQICLNMANSCLYQYDLTKNGVHLELAHMIYLVFMRQGLFTASDLLVNEYIKFLAFSPLKSQEVLDDLLVSITLFADIDPETHLLILYKFIYCEKVSYSCKYTWAAIRSKRILADGLGNIESHQLREEFVRAVFNLFHKLNSNHRVKEASALLLTAIEKVLKEPFNQPSDLMRLGFPSFETMWELWGDLVITNDEPLSIHLFLFLEKSGLLKVIPHKAEYSTSDGHQISLEYPYFVQFYQMVTSSALSQVILPKTAVCSLDDNNPGVLSEISLNSLISLLRQKIERPENLVKVC